MSPEDYDVLREYLDTVPAHDEIEIVTSIVWEANLEEIVFHLHHELESVRHFVSYRLERGI